MWCFSAADWGREIRSKRTDVNRLAATCNLSLLEDNVMYFDIQVTKGPLQEPNLCVFSLLSKRSYLQAHLPSPNFLQISMTAIQMTKTDMRNEAFSDALISNSTRAVFWSSAICWPLLSIALRTTMTKQERWSGGSGPGIVKNTLTRHWLSRPVHLLSEKSKKQQACQSSHQSM